MDKIQIDEILNELGYPENGKYCLPKTYEEIIDFANYIEKKIIELYKK